MMLLGSNVLGNDKLKPIVIRKSLRARLNSNTKSLSVIYKDDMNHLGRNYEDVRQRNFVLKREMLSLLSIIVPPTLLSMV